MKKSYLGNLDLIKALAATCIVFHHYQQISAVRFETGIDFYGGQFVFGYLVELFFIISGFLTEFTFRDGVRFKAWFTGKILRIFPFAFFACMFSLLTAAVYRFLTGSSLFGMNYSLPVILASLFLVFSGWMWEISPAVNNPAWYLCVLILCYLLYWAVRERGKKYSISGKLTFTVMALLFVPVYHFVTHGFPDIPFFRLSNIRGYGSFFVGCALCSLTRFQTKKTVYIADAVLWGLTAAGFRHRGLSDWYVLTYCFFPAVVLLALDLPQIRAEALKAAGAVSFELYLWHVPVYGLLLTAFTVTGRSVAHSRLTMLLFAVLVWMWAAAVYHWIEKPLTEKLNALRK